MRSDFRGALLSKIKMRSLPSRSLPALTRARNPRTERKGANATQSENQIRQLSDSGQKILLIDGLRIPPTTAKTHKNSATAHAHASDGSARRRTTVTATCVAALEYRMCSAFAVHAAQQCEPSVLVANRAARIFIRCTLAALHADTRSPAAATRPQRARHRACDARQDNRSHRAHAARASGRGREWEVDVGGGSRASAGAIFRAARDLVSGRVLGFLHADRDARAALRSPGRRRARGEVERIFRAYGTAADRARQ